MILSSLLSFRNSTATAVRNPKNHDVYLYKDLPSLLVGVITVDAEVRECYCTFHPLPLLFLSFIRIWNDSGVMKVEAILFCELLGAEIGGYLNCHSGSGVARHQH